MKNELFAFKEVNLFAYELVLDIQVCTLLIVIQKYFCDVLVVWCTLLPDDVLSLWHSRRTRCENIAVDWSLAYRMHYAEHIFHHS